MCGKVPKSVKKCRVSETILPFSCCPFVLLRVLQQIADIGHVYKRVHICFGIEMSFSVVSRWPKSPFGIEISFLVLRSLFLVLRFHILDCLLPGINQCVVFRASTSCKMEVQEDLDTKGDQKISIPQQRHVDANYKSRPV